MRNLGVMPVAVNYLVEGEEVRLIEKRIYQEQAETAHKAHKPDRDAGLGGGIEFSDLAAELTGVILVLLLEVEELWVCGIWVDIGLGGFKGLTTSLT